jgi:hypothetical protein
MPRNETEAVAEKLDTLIQLVSIAVSEDRKQKEQIRKLTMAGLKPTRMAAALGTTADTVKVAIANMRKAKTLLEAARQR